MRIILYGLGLTIVLAMTPTARADTEEPRFDIVDKVGVMEIRQYDKRLAAEVCGRRRGRRCSLDRLPPARGFHLRQQYDAQIDRHDGAGGAQAANSETIAMTAPVSQSREGSGKWRVRFYMPSKYTSETLPKPNNPAVQIVDVPGETMAVLRFSNSRSAEAVAEKTAELLQALARSKWLASGTPVTWFYDPPWTLPFFRRNEVAVPVRPR